jgi:hypothetical protein
MLCDSKFTTSHFFTCSRFFTQDSGWKILVELCRTESWEDVMDFIFEILRKWVEETTFFNASFRLYVFEYVNLRTDVARSAFRWHV